MTTRVRTVIALALAACMLVLAAAACRSEPAPANATTEIPSGRQANAAVSGSVTYRERLALTPEATLIVELRDVSYADASAALIARQTIDGPGQAPIRFRVEYNRDDIDERNRYSIQAKIIEADGRLAFTNDTAYEVITRGNPNKVDMLLVLVQPPPDLVDEGAADWRTWVETRRSTSSGPTSSRTSRSAGCASPTTSRPSRAAPAPATRTLQVDGRDILVRVTLMQPPPTAWAIPCDEEVVELDTVLPIATPLEPGQTYRVIVNDRETTTFAPPASDLPHTFIAESPIERAEVETSGSAPAHYALRVVSGLPTGSNCSQFNGYEIRRAESNRIDVLITHHQVADANVVCTADYPVVETTVPLGADFEPGVEYTVVVNADTSVEFVPGSP